MENCIGREDFYEELTLNETMKKFESKRSTELKREGKMQMNYTKSTDGWIATLFIIQGRAIDWMIFPWIFATLHATIYTVVQEMWVIRIEQDMTSWEVFFSFVLNSTLSFLLVFRLNRAAGRFWAARKYWGDIVAQVRSCVGGLIIHGSHNIAERDNTIRWIVAFTISTMELLRGEKRYPQNILAGILKQSEVEDLERQPHPPMYAVDRARYHMNQIFKVDADTAPHLAFSMTQQMNTLENQLNVMIWSGGGMERIRSTPLPIVYVSHLRTFIMISLLLYPWVFGASWGWSTIPAVALAGFAWLGIESAAVEVESPFGKNRVNALNMDGYILGLLVTIQQQLENHSEYKLLEKCSSI